MAGNGGPQHSYHTIPPKDMDWWSEDAMVRFGTNTQRTAEPAWQDVGANVLRMDSLYDASFHDWLKCEDNVSIIASYLQRIANEYPMDRIINALRWLVSSWRVESTAVIVRHITADWAVSPNAPKAPPPMPFRLEPPPPPAQPADPAMLAGEARRGLLVRELTKDWTCQQIAQLVGMLSLTFWSERTYLEGFLRTLVSDWDFCRLSSFFSYISSQLGLDYRVKVSMLQQAARRNASRLSLKRARNGAPKPVAAAAAADSDEPGTDSDDGGNKRGCHEPTEFAASCSDAAPESPAAATPEFGPGSASGPLPSTATPAAAAAASAATLAARPDTQSSTIAIGATELPADASNSSTCPIAPAASALPPASLSSRRSPLVSDTTAMDCSDDNDDDTDELLITPHAPSADANSAAATATRPQNDQQQQQGLQYEQPAQAEPERQMSTPPQQRRRARNTSARSPTMPNTSSPLAASASFSGQVPPPSDIVARRPLTPHIASAVFVTDPEVHPTSPTVRRHRHNRSYQNHDCAQPLTPTHSSTSLVTFAAANAEADDQHSASSPVQLASSSMLLPRPAMRLHAASISSAGGSQLRRGSSSDSSGSGPSTTGTGAAEQPPQQTHEQQEPPPQQLEYRARTPSESELGQFDGPPSTHLALPLPSESPSNASTLCSRTSAAPYDVLGIVMADSEHHVAEPSA